MKEKDEIKSSPANKIKYICVLIYICIYGYVNMHLHVYICVYVKTAKPVHVLLCCEELCVLLTEGIKS